MIRSHKKYADPTPVLNMLVDDFANHIPVGDQKDVTEFNITFLTRVEEALQLQESFQKRTSLRKTITEPPSEDGLQTKSVLVKKLSTIGDAEDTFMSNTFFGKIRNFRSYFQDGEKVVDVEDSLFGSVILDVAQKDLYAGFDAWLNIEVDDFRAPNGELCKAEKNSWIIKAPDTLFIQLQRVVYNRNIGNIEKLNTPFYFDKEIYIDRFLFENKDIATEIKHKVRILQNKLEHLEVSLAKIQNYKKTGFDLISVLGIASDFLKTQLGDKPAPGAKPQPTDPVYVGLMEDKEVIVQTFNTLGQYQQFLSQKKEELQNEIKKIKDEIDGYYAQLKKEKYVLSSILIHDGGAGSGHYYSFIRGNDGSWKRYNDIQVSDETEGVVFKEALGGNGHKSAYCVVYVSQKSLDEENKYISRYRQNTSSGNSELEVPKQHYNLFLKENLKNTVDKDNKLFQEELEEYRFHTFMKRISENYESRLDTLNAAYSSGSKQQMPFYINSFGLFLKNEIKTDYLLKWYVLDTCLQETNPNFKFKLRELKNQPRLLKILQTTISSLGKNYQFKELVLQKEDDQLLDTKLAEYIITIPAAIVCLFLLEKSMREEWPDTLLGIKKLNDMNFAQGSFFAKMNNNIAGVLALYLASKLELLLASERFEGIEILENALYALTKGMLKQDDSQISQVKAILNDIVTHCQDKINAEQMKKFKEFVFKMSTGFHISTELDKVVGNSTSEELEKRIAVTTTEEFDPYRWVIVNENSYSNQIKRLFEKFCSHYKVWVEFYNMIYYNKAPLKKEQRWKHNFIVKEESAMNSGSQSRHQEYGYHAKFNGF